MAGLPLLAPPGSMDRLDGLLMVRLPFRDDIRQLAFRTFNAPSKPHVSKTEVWRRLAAAAAPSGMAAGLSG
jgi:hypothetical protein